MGQSGFGQTLRAAREKKGLSQAELARLVGVQSGAVWRWEFGLRNPRMELVPKIAAALGVTADSLLAKPDGGATHP